MHKRSLTLLLAAALALGACGSSDDSASPATTTTNAPAAFPVTVQTAEGAVTIDARPEHIVSLSPSSTEMLFAIGAGEQVAAVDDQSNFPPEAPTTGLSGFEPNAEAVAAEDPDLVVLSDAEILPQLEQLDIPAIVQPTAATLDDSYEQIDQLGLATGHSDEAAGLVAEMRGDLEEITTSAEPHDPPFTYYYELDSTYFSVTSGTFIGALFSLLGLENIADAADDSGSGYPQLSAEYIVDQDPDFVFLADTKCCDQTAQTVADRPGWGGMHAVTADQVVELDDDVASRWGPRVVDLLREIQTAVANAGA